MILNKMIIGILLIVATLLLIPLIAMLFTDEVKWSVFDFLVAAVLLLGTGFAGEFVWRKVKNTNGRIAICLALLALLLLVWVEMAVGIFDSPIAGN